MCAASLKLRPAFTDFSPIRCAAITNGSTLALRRGVAVPQVATHQKARMQNAETLRAHQAEIVDRGVAQIMSVNPAYRKSRDPKSKKDVRAHVDVHHDFIVQS